MDDVSFLKKLLECDHDFSLIFIVCRSETATAPSSLVSGVCQINRDRAGSENWMGNKIASHTYFSPNQKGDEKLVTKVHQHT